MPVDDRGLSETRGLTLLGRLEAMPSGAREPSPLGASANGTGRGSRPLDNPACCTPVPLPLPLPLPTLARGESGGDSLPATVDGELLRLRERCLTKDGR